MIRNLRSLYGMGFIGLLMVVAMLMLSGCGSSPSRPKGPAPDQELERFNRSARLAFDKGRDKQAANLYRKALERAYVRDDSAAILDARYNLAVCLLNLQAYQEALEEVRRAKIEMALVQHGTSFDFLILEATLLHRSGNTYAAWQITDQILSDPTQDSSIIRSKTHFLRGLMASEQAKMEQLRSSIADLGRPEKVQLRANRQELLGRLAMAEQDWPAAIEAFNRTIRLRREALDYRAMVSALVLAGEASEKAEYTRKAAVFYLRAGRSVFWQDQLEDAKRWLNHSAYLANIAGEDQILQEAHRHLHKISELAEPASVGSVSKGISEE